MAPSASSLAFEIACQIDPGSSPVQPCRSWFELSGAQMFNKLSELGGFLALASMAASAAGSAPAWTSSSFSNDSKARWEFIERDGDHHCLLRSRIGTAAPFEFADFETAIGQRSISLRLHGPANGQPVQDIEAGYQIGDGKPQSQKSTEYDKNGERNLGFDFRGEDAAAIYARSTIRIAISTDRGFLIDTAALGGHLKEADACWRRRFLAAGADARLIAKVAAEPDGDLSALFSFEDYPSAALRNDQTGRVSALVIIDKDGRAKDCDVIVSSSSMALDEATCNIVLRRTKIEPGKDAKGRPIDAPTIVNVEWLLP